MFGLANKLLVVTALGTGFVLVLRPHFLLPAIQASPALAGNAAPVDLQGDPLPAGAIARLGTVRFRVAGRLTFAPDGKTIAGVYHDVVRLWDAATGKEIRRFGRHEPWATSAVFSPDGKTLATAGADKVVILWEVATGKEIRRFTSHEGAVWCVAFTFDGKRTASAGEIGGGSCVVRLVDLDTNKEVQWFRHKSRVGQMAFTPDGKALVTACGDGIVRLWDAATGAVVRQFQREKAWPGFDTLAISPDGKQIAAGGDHHDPVVHVWEASTGKLLYQLTAQSYLVTAIAFAPDGKTLATAGGRRRPDDGSVERVLVLWDAATGKELRRLGPSGDWVASLAWSPDGKALAVGSPGTIHLFDPATGQELRPFPGHREGIYQLAVAPDGKTIATAAGDDTIRVWETATGKELHWQGDVRPSVLGFAADGKRVIAVAGRTVHFWDVVTGKATRRHNLEDTDVHAAALSADGAVLATTSTDNLVKLWQTDSGKEIANLGKHYRSRLVLSADGKTVVLVSGDGHDSPTRVHLWDGVTGKQIREVKPQLKQDDLDRLDIRRLALAPDGKSLGVILRGSRAVALWDAVTGKELWRSPEHEHEHFCITFSPDSRFLAVGNWDKSVRVYNTSSGKVVAHLVGHQDHVNGLAFTPDGKKLASASYDTTVLIWDAEGWAKRK